MKQLIETLITLVETKGTGRYSPERLNRRALKAHQAQKGKENQRYQTILDRAEAERDRTEQDRWDLTPTQSAQTAQRNRDAIYQTLSARTKPSAKELKLYKKAGRLATAASKKGK